MLRAALVMGSIGLGVASCIYVLRNTKTLDDGNNEALAPALTEEETLTIMRSIMDKIKMTAMRMLQASEGIKAQLAQQGQEMEDRKLMKTFIYQHFMDQVEQIQTAVLGENDAEENELEEAVEEYVKTDSELKDIVTKIKALHYQFGGDKDEEGTLAEEAATANLPEISFDEVMVMIEALSTRISEAMDEYIADFKDLYGIPDASSMEPFQHGFMTLTEKIEKEMLLEFDYPALAFQAAITKYSDQPLLQEAFMKMQYANAQKMQELGIQ